MISYTSTPDYYRDYIEHGWLKDQAAKAHKYLERWRGKNGKWYYRYKSKAQEQVAKAKRAINGFESDEVSDFSKPSNQSRAQAQKAKKKWMEKGVHKSYKARKDKISNAKANAHKKWDDKQNKMQSLRSKYSKAHPNGISKAEINVARGDARRKEGQQQLGILGYDTAHKKYTKPKKKKTKILETIYFENGKAKYVKR